jgi:hypothetical protein
MVLIALSLSRCPSSRAPEDGDADAWETDAAGEVGPEEEGALEGEAQGEPGPEALEEALEEEALPPDVTPEETGEDAIEEEAAGEAPVVQCYVVTAAGSVGLLDDVIALGAEDEPAKYAGTPGFQLDVGAQATNVENGREAVLSLAGLDVGSAPMVLHEGTGMAAVQFTEVTLQQNPEGFELQVRVTNAAGLTGTCTKTVKLDTGLCEVSLAPLPVASGCVGEDADPGTPGFQMVFTVANPSQDCPLAVLSYAVGESPETLTEAVPISGGQVEIALTVSQDEAGLNGVPVAVTAFVEDPDHPEKNNKTNAYLYHVDTDDPVVTVTTPQAGDVLLTADLDGNPDNGIQLTFAGTLAGMNPGMLGNRVELKMAGAGTFTETEPGDAFLFEAVGFSADGHVEAYVVATDACRRVGTAQLGLDLYTKSPFVQVITPQDGVTLPSKNDGNPFTPTTYEADAVVLATDLPIGRTLSVLCRPAGSTGAYTPVGSLQLEIVPANKLFTVPVAIDTSVLGTAVSCIAAHDYPNGAPSAAVGLTLALPGPAIAIAKPVPGRLTNKLTLTVEVTASGLDGQAVHLQIADAGGAVVVDSPAFFTVQNGAAFASLDISALADGPYTLRLDATDALGNVLSEQPGVVNTVSFAIDRTPPGLSLVNPPSLSIVDAQHPDENATMKGFQATLGFALIGEAHLPGSRVCAVVLGSDFGCQVVDAAGGVSFADVTLLPGPNDVQATATDGAGNATTPQGWVVTRVAAPDKPRVEFAVPSQDVVRNDPNLDVVIRVTDPATGAPITNASIFLTRNGLDAASTSTNQGGLYTLPVILGEGANDLQARAIAGAQSGYSNFRRVTYKSTFPTAQFLIPQDGAVFNLASPECAAAAQNCYLTVSATTINAGDGDTALLTVTCSTAVDLYETTVSGGTVTFEDVALYDQQQCFLTIKITDAAGQVAHAGPQAVTVDRVKPAFLSVNVPQYLHVYTDEDPVKPGIQYTPVLKYRGLEKTRDVTLVITDGTGATQTVTLQTSAAVGDNSEATLSFGRLDWPDGVDSYVFSATDLAGNPATLSGNTVVSSDVPLVFMYSPDYVEEKSCTTDSECAPGRCIGGGCYVVWNKSDGRTISITTQGLLIGPGSGENVRLCSDRTDLPGAACATGGFKTVQAFTFTSANSVVTASALPDGAHKVIVEGLTPTGTWASSLGAQNPVRRYRMIYQDTLAPIVTELAVTSDTQAPFNVLSKVEKALDGTFGIRVTSSEDGTAALYVSGLKKTTAAVVGGTASIAAALADGTPSLQARVTDAFGNEGAAAPEPALSLLVDTLPPALEFQAPLKPVLIVGDSPDVLLLSDGPGITVQLFDGGTPMGSSKLTGADFKATFVDALALDGSYALSASATDVALNSKTAQPPYSPVVVDRTPPLLAVGAPSNLATLDDLDAGTPGFQALLRFGVTSGATWRIFLSRDCDAAFTQCGVASQILAGPVTVPGGPEPDVTYTLPGATTPFYALRFEAVDDHGNVASETRNVSLNITGCQVSITNLPTSGYLGNALCAVPGQDCATIQAGLQAHFLGTCPGVQALQLWENNSMVDSQPAAGGVAVFTRTYSHDQSLQLQVRAIDAALAVVDQSPQYHVVIDLQSPVVNFVADTIQGFNTPPTGAQEVYGQAADQDLGSPDLQIHVDVLATDGHLAGGSFKSLTRTVGAVTTDLTSASLTLPAAIAGSPYNAIVQFVTLEDGVNTVTAQVTDAAGNLGMASFQATVDTVPPAAITLAAITAADVNRRLPAVDLAWVAPGDDGDQGTAVSYDVRFSRAPITDEASFANACQAANITALDPLAAPQPAGGVEALTVRGPDVRSPTVTENGNGQLCKFVVGQDLPAAQKLTYHFAIRAKDDAGNYSPINAGAVASTDLLNLHLATLAFSGAVGDAAMHRVSWPLGDVNADGLADFLHYSSALNQACVVLGWNDGTPEQTIPDRVINTSVSTGHRCFLPAPGGKAIGLRSAGFGDLDGDGVGDFGIGQGTTPERVEVFLGVSTAAAGSPEIPDAPFLVITGHQNAANPFGSQVFQVGDFNGDGLADIGVASRLTNVFYLVLGDSNWTSGATPLWAPGDPALTLNLATPASYGPFKVVRITLTGWTDPSSFFGWTAVPAGNLLPDAGVAQYNDVAITLRQSPQSVFVVSGRATPDAITDIPISATLDGTAAGDATALQILPEAGVTATGFGYELAGGADLDGNGVPDLVINQPSQGAVADKPWGVYVMRGEAMTVGTHVNGVGLPVGAVPIGETVVNGSRGVIIHGSFNNVRLLGDFDQEGFGPASSDLGMVRYSTSTWGTAWLRMDEADAANGILPGTFPYRDLSLVSPVATATTFGYSLYAPGDVNGDGVPDVVVTTNSDAFTVIVY